MAISKKSLILFVLIVIEILLITYCRNIFGSLVSPVILLLVSTTVGIIIIRGFKREESPHQILEFRNADKQTLDFILLFVVMTVISMFFPKRGFVGIVHSFLIDPKYSDVIPTIQVMCKRFVSGEPVYQYIENFGYKIAPSYMPMVWMPYVPAEILHFDYRYFMWIFWLAGVVLLLYIGIRKRNGLIPNLLSTLLLGFFIFSLVDKEPAALGWTPELANATFYILLAIGLLCDNLWIKAAVIAGCLLSRYSVVLFLPIIYFIEWQQYGIKKSIKLLLYTILIVCGLIIPMVNNHWHELYDGYKYYSVSGLGEWQHLDGNGLPIHILNGNGLVAWVYTFKKGTIEDKFAFMHVVHLSFVFLTVAGLFVYYWLKRAALNAKWYIIGALKIYLTVFYGFIQVPYTYLFLVPVLYSIAVFVLLNKGSAEMKNADL